MKYRHTLEQSKYEHDLFTRAEAKWGKASQMAMLAEECSELSASVLHIIRGREVDIAEEIADVLICIEQWYTMFDGLETKAKFAKEKKLLRLEERLNLI